MTTQPVFFKVSDTCIVDLMDVRIVTIEGDCLKIHCVTTTAFIRENLKEAFEKIEGAIKQIKHPVHLSNYFGSEE
jgi:hypothetical protein